MKRLMKVLVGAGVVLLILVVGVFFWINQLAKAGIERGATYALGVDTTVDKASIGVFSGQFGLGGLRVANPQPFSPAAFLKLGEGDVSVTMGSLMRGQVEVPRVTLSNVELTLEYNGDLGNYDVILENLQGPGTDDPSPAPPEPDTGDEEPGKKFIVREIVIENVVVNTDFKLVGDKSTKMTFNIPKIELHDVGSDSGGGVVLSQLSGTVIQAVLEAVVQQGADVLPDLVIGSLDAGLDGLGKLGDQIAVEGAKVVKDIGENVEKGLKEVGGEVEKGVDEVGEAVEGVGKDLEKGLNQLFEGLGKKADEKQ